MYERDVQITTHHGKMPAFVVAPHEDGQWPVIIFYMDAPGFREELCDMARKIAKQGYFVVLPDLYYRIGTVRFDLPRREETMSQVVRACVNHAMNRAQIIDDTGSVIGYVDGQAQAKDGPIGIVGYCMGGPFITWAAEHYSDRIKGAASLYGVRMVNELEQSPHNFIGKVKGEIYYGFAEHDNAAPPEVIEQLTKIMEENGVKHKVEILPGTKHGFCFPSRGAYSPAASEQVWRALFDLWDRTLKQ